MDYYMMIIYARTTRKFYLRNARNETLMSPLISTSSIQDFAWLFQERALLSKATLVFHNPGKAE